MAAALLSFTFSFDDYVEPAFTNGPGRDGTRALDAAYGLR